jgi:hypothetical protein
VLQPRAFAPQFLRARRVVPDAGELQFAAYFLETFAPGFVVKETP